MFVFLNKKENQKKATVSHTPEEFFWNWFLKNQQKIEDFIDQKHDNQEIYFLLTKKIKEYNSLLFPELTKKDDKYVLIITPDGIKEGVRFTQQLFDKHPILDNWIFQKFRQPNDDILLNFDGLSYNPNDIEIIPEIDEKAEKVNIHVFIRNMNNNVTKHQHLAFLYLDHILGEFNTITKVGYIDFHHLDPGKGIEDSISIKDLRELIEDNLY